MLTLVTGVPGTGKTLFALTELSKIKNRPIYYHGIPDLSDALGWIPLDDPFNFHKELPNGAIVVIDEVQKVFRQRPPKNPVPDALQFCETHRHHGVDIWFITQRPKFLDHHARGLSGRHVHFHRNFGLSQSVQYDFNRYTDTEDRRLLREGEKSKFKFPESSYGLYKSAEVHTHKRRLPKKLMLIPFGIAFVVGIIWWGVSGLLNRFDSPGQDIASVLPGGSPSNVTFGYWQSAFKPEIEGLPFTAPIYKEVAVAKTAPMIKGCISTADKSRCSCYSQQGTRIQMKIAQCLHFVRNPYFDFTKDPRKNKDIKPIIRSDMPVIVPSGDGFDMAGALARSL